MLHFMSTSKHCELQTARIREETLIYIGEILIRLLKSHISNIILKLLISLTLCGWGPVEDFEGTEAKV